MAKNLEDVLGKSVVVVNKSGAGGTIGAASVATSAADGYTIFFAESSLLVAPHLNPALGFTLSSFTPVAPVGALPFAIVSTPTFPAKTVAELIPLLKSKPGQFSYASPGVGNIGHLSAELFQQLAGVKLLHVPYQGGGKLVADVMSGEVPLSFISVSPILPLVRAGKLNLLAVTTPSRAVFAPNAPTVAESLPGFATATNFFVLAPANLPPAVRDTLAAAVKQTLRTKGGRTFAAQGCVAQRRSDRELREQVLKSPPAGDKSQVPISSHSSTPPKATANTRLLLKVLITWCSAGKRVDRVITDPARRQLSGPPISMVIAYAPGSGTGVIGRVIAQQLGAVLKQSVVVVNKAGAGGDRAANVAGSPADG
ncbi:MAG: hypothetical protein IPI73_25950 [Betaproteobacteria bacterium]|nr:hypothetical protein [Betaproteobacteria bacterium]